MQINKGFVPVCMVTGGDGAKRSGTCHDGDSDGGFSESAGDDEEW